MKGASHWLQQFKLRASIGSSGNQNYSSNVSLPVYVYYNSNYFNGFSGASLSNMENPNIGWEQKMDYNIGIDFRTRRINAVLDLYVADTQNMVFSRSILPSTGFSTVNDNLGMVRNKGVELSLSYIVFQKRSSFIRIFGKTAYNDNRFPKLLKPTISDKGLKRTPIAVLPQLFSTITECPSTQYGPCLPRELTL